MRDFLDDGRQTTDDGTQTTDDGTQFNNTLIHRYINLSI